VRRVGRLDAARGGLPVCGGEVLQPRVVVWCTGFTPDFSWIDAPVFDERGMPRHRRGVVPEAPGLHFVGLRFQHRMTSSLIGGVGEDAAFVAERVARAAALEPAVP
jgi:putative flavoprotein involved in K+ transport